KTDALADAARVALVEDLGLEVRRRPPARKLPCVGEDVRDLLRRAQHAPVRRELIFGRAHRPEPDFFARAPEGGGTSSDFSNPIRIRSMGLPWRKDSSRRMPSRLKPTRV